MAGAATDRELLTCERCGCEVRPVPAGRRVTFRLPFPPSVNNYWKPQIFWPKGWHRVLKGLFAKFGRPRADIYVGTAGKKYRDEVRQALPRGLPVRSRLAVSVRLCRGDRVSFDVDNFNKSLLDALSHAEFWADDEQIDELHVYRGPVLKGAGRAEVTVRLLPNPQGALFGDTGGEPELEAPF